jgi:subfamily B ATP-binding cassette protein MsbA
MRNLWRLLGYLRPYLGQLVLASLLLAVSGALMAVVVSTVKPLVDEVLLSRPQALPQPETVPGQVDILSRFRSLLRWGGLSDWSGEHAFFVVPILIVAIFVVRGIFLYFGQYLTLKSGASMIRDLRVQLYEAVAYQSLAFFQAHPTGVILSRILNDVARVQHFAAVSLADLVRVVIMAPFLLLTAFYHDWKMSLLALLALPLLGYPLVRLGRRLRRAATASQQNMAQVAHKLTESIAGVRVVQGFGMEPYEVGRFGQVVGRMLRADLRAGRAAALAPAVMELFGAVAGAVLFYIAGWNIARGTSNAGSFAVVLFCLGMLFMSFRRLSAIYTELQHVLAAATRVFDMLDRERQIRDLPDARPLAAFGREIRYRGVSFSYGDEDVLQGIDVRIARGEVVALVGASGSGKSTLANLLPRFYDPTAGAIEIDGTDIRAVTLASLREQIGLVTQETVLFDDTVRNNIAYGRPDVPLVRVSEAARAAHALGFVEKLPQGFDTMLGERGSRLSLGQRQRLAIARALLKDPPILILDEATSALDAESEALVQQALETLMHGRTSIVIAHRLSTVRRADRILVLDEGRVVEQGSHRELLTRGGVYARLYELQFEESPA